MRMQESVGTFNQGEWPGAGDVDDCAPVSDMRAVHLVAPWLWLPTVPNYRAAAGNPDDPGPDGLSIRESARAIRALWARLGELITVSDARITWARFAELSRLGRPSSLSVLAGALPNRGYAFAGGHRITALWRDGWYYFDPLDRAHRRAKRIGAAELREAVRARGPNVSCILLPTVEDAFATHPLLDAALSAAAGELGDRIAMIQAKVAALAADIADD